MVAARAHLQHRKAHFSDALPSSPLAQAQWRIADYDRGALVQGVAHSLPGGALDDLPAAARVVTACVAVQGPAAAQQYDRRIEVCTPERRAFVGAGLPDRTR